MGKMAAHFPFRRPNRGISNRGGGGHGPQAPDPIGGSCPQLQPADRSGRAASSSTPRPYAAHYSGKVPKPKVNLRDW